MARRGLIHNFKPLQLLTEEECQSIHRSVLEVLWVTGARIEHERALELLRAAGCKVDDLRRIARFPPELVEESLRRCPSVFHVKARHEDSHLMFGPQTTYLSPFPGMNTVDLLTWEPRRPTRRDFYECVRVEDALETVSLMQQYTPYFGFENVPPAMAMLESMAAKVRNSTKALSEGYANDCEVFTIQMAQAVAAEMLVPCLPAAPLTYYGDAIEAALRGNEAGFPVKLATGVVPGATAPATIAGAIVSASAELIPPIVLLQHLSPGTRIVVSDLIFPQNMRTGCPAFGAIGSSLCTAGFNQMWRRYGVPTSNTATPSSSKMIDFQCGYEKATSALLFALSGGSLLQFHGGVHGELTHHPLQAILDDDVAAMIGRFLEGISVNQEMLAVDLINAVGPIPGHFLNQEHTRKWWRQEQFLPKAADRLTYPEWMNSGKKSCLDYARERMDEILATHRLVPLTTRQEEDVERILEDARQYYRERGSISDDEMAVYRRSMTSADYPYQ